jgi:serine/threonine protein phosphatase PrpC
MGYSPPNYDSTRSVRLYRLLLLAYPRTFREEYAAEMLLVFRDAYLDTLRRQGTLGVLLLWWDFFCDFVKTVCIEHGRSWMQRGERAFVLAGKDSSALMLQFTLDVAQHTDIGRMRANNEDNLISVVPQDSHLLRAKGALFVVADGMSSHSLGEVASELAVEKIKEHYYQDLQDDIPTALLEAIKLANAVIYQANEVERAQGAKDFVIGTTCVAAVLHDKMLYAANVGDSRIYVLHEGQLRQITRDHSLVAQLVERGEITPAEARSHEKRNQIYRWLGLQNVEADLFIEPVEEGDTLILCTDGLCGVVEDEDLRTIVEQHGPEESVQHLIARANEEGGPDNVTAIVVCISVGSTDIPR